MKYPLRGALVFAACLIGAFLWGLLFIKPRITPTTFANVKKSSPACTSTHTCVTSPLSLFSKQLLLQSEINNADALPPSGFCLNVPVLLYHHIQPQEIAQEKGQTSLNVDTGIFDSQMAYLSTNGYTTISADQLVNALLTHTQLPQKSIVVTADDGYLDIYTYAYPIIQKYNITLNLMVPTGLLGVISGTNSYYSWGQLKEMIGSGHIFVYNHTWSHYPLAQGPASKDIYEMKTAQDQLQQQLGKASPIFVYPYGSGQGISWVMDLVKQQGYVAAFSTLYGRFQCASNMMALPRIRVGNAPLSSYGI